MFDISFFQMFARHPKLRRITIAVVCLWGIHAIAIAFGGR